MNRPMYSGEQMDSMNSWYGMQGKCYGGFIALLQRGDIWEEENKKVLVDSGGCELLLGCL